MTAPKVCRHYTTSRLVINRRHFGPRDKVPLVRIAGVVDVIPLSILPQRTHKYKTQLRLTKSKLTVVMKSYAQLILDKRRV